MADSSSPPGRDEPLAAQRLHRAAGRHQQAVAAREIALEHVGADQAVAADAVAAGDPSPLSDHGEAAAQMSREAAVGPGVAAVTELAAGPDDDLLVEDDPVQHGVHAD